MIKSGTNNCPFPLSKTLERSLGSITASLKRSGQEKIEGRKEMEASRNSSIRLVEKHASDQAIEGKRIMALLSTMTELKYQLKEERSNYQAFVTERLKTEED